MTGVERIGAAYRRDTDVDRPLGAYAALLATWSATVAAAGVLGRRRPGRLAPADLLTAAVATTPRPGCWHATPSPARCGPDEEARAPGCATPWGS